MGFDKKFIVLDGVTFLEHTINNAKKFADEIIIVVGSNSQRDETRKLTDLKIVVDEKPNMGPIMGVLTGLKHCSSEYAAVMPVDTPLASPEVYRYMESESKGMDAVIPVEGEHLEPLHAVYRVKAMRASCEQTLREGKKSVYLAARRLKNVRLIPLEKFKEIDEKLLTFRSINTPGQLEELKNMMESEKAWM
jgi:molybdopterin-guanine dinucleotide biosynthesis protein A